MNQTKSKKNYYKVFHVFSDEKHLMLKTDHEK